MASVYLRVDQLHTDRSGTPFSWDGNRDYENHFLVEVSDKRLGSIAVCNAPGLPLPWDFYRSADDLEWDLLALCTKISAKSDGGNMTFGRWIVTCNYSTRMPPGGKPQGWSSPDKKTGSQNNPELEPPDIEWDGEKYDHAAPYDLKKKPYLNSAYQPFKPAHVRPEGMASLLISRNELNFNRQTATKYAFAVSSDRFLGADPETVQCMPIKAKMVIKGSLAYWRVSYRFNFGPEQENGLLKSWQPSVLDQGTHELHESSGPALPDQLTGPQVLVPIFINGVAISSDVCLDGKGHRKLPNKDGVVEPVYLEFKDFRRKPFSKLLLRGFGPGGGK